MTNERKQIAMKQPDTAALRERLASFTPEKEQEENKRKLEGLLQETVRMTDALENNCKAADILGERLEILETGFSEALSKIEKAASSLREIGKVTVSEKARKTLEREGERICRKMADRLRNECTELFDRLSAEDRVVIPGVLFLCMIEVIIFLLSAMICFIAANVRFIHSTILWEIIGYITCVTVVFIVLTVLMCRQSKR